jgi:precorrin-3B C17-methyltransferase
MKIYVIGIGPGGQADLTPRARRAIEASDLIFGYQTYINLVAKFFPGKRFIASRMKKETERCRQALTEALAGQTVALISSGDSGIYGMAGIMLEIAALAQPPVTVEIIPGITAASSAAALAGAPLAHDFAVISLSDLLTPWKTIQNRIEFAARADFVICFYNPKSNRRMEQIAHAQAILLRYKGAATPVCIARQVGREGESCVLTTLEKMLESQIDMFTVIIVGNSQTYLAGGKMITPRGYLLQ